MSCKVKDYIAHIDMDVLRDKAEENSYWLMSCNFVLSILNREVDDLLEKQMKWLDRIVDDLEKEKV